MKHKTAKQLWTLIAIIGIAAMLFFTLLPALQ
jgi:hypothetical protein